MEARFATADHLDRYQGMPRVARIHSVGVVHHVISRFVDRSWRLSDDEERHTYLKRLEYR